MKRFDDEQQASELDHDYYDRFIPSVHRIGAYSAAISVAAMLLPVVYLLFVRKYYLGSPVPYIALALNLLPGMLPYYFMEPLMYWPFIGSAGIYMSYLSGNCAQMRIPVAVSVQRSLDASVDTPKGQVVTIISIAVSIIFNALLLLIVVLFGNWIYSHLPDVVRSMLSYAPVCCIAVLLCTKLLDNRPRKVSSGLLSYWPCILGSALCYYFIHYCAPGLSVWGPVLTMGICVLISYIIFRKNTTDDTADEAGGSQT